MATQTIHPFEQAGLGLAPFHFIGMSENAIQLPGGSSRAGGCCDYCYTGIRYEYHIKSYDGKTSKVGCDCILKLERADNKLISEAKRAKALFEQKKKEAIRAEKARIRREEMEKELQRQREQNGGLTNRELEQKKQEELDQANRAEWSTKNQWLLEVLDKEYQSDFITSMISKIETMSIGSLSDRCICILRDIYAKSFGRRSSKKYNQAMDDFDSRI